MPALEAGASAPDISLPTASDSNFSLQEALKRGPVLAAFFKVSCPVCQFTLPYLERIYRAYPRDKVTIVGVSQDEKYYADIFAREFRISFPFLLDETDRYPVSNAYGLTHVPTIFLIAPGGDIKLTVVGWDRRDMEKLNAEVAKAAGSAAKPLFHPGEDVPDFKAG